MQPNLKFYDLQPRDGSHYLLGNGEPIARLNELSKAEAVCARYVAKIGACTNVYAVRAGQGDRGHDQRAQIPFPRTNGALWAPRIFARISKQLVGHNHAWGSPLYFR
jgi:hypothetical protein